MSDEPIRLRDAASPEGRLLARAAKVPAMSSADRAAILAGLPAPPGGGGGGEGGLSMPAIVGGGLAVAAAVAIFVLARTTPSSSVATPPISASAAAVAPPSVSASAPSPTVAESATTPGVSASAAPSVAAPPAVTIAPAISAARPDDADSLAEEGALVRAARASIDTDPAASLAKLDEHARRFPRGQLAPERDVLAIRALRKLGRAAEADARARDYPKKYPSSPYAPAVSR